MKRELTILGIATMASLSITGHEAGLAPGGEIPVEYRDPALFHVRVIDQFDDPVDNAQVTVRSWMDILYAETDENGEFDIVLPTIRTAVDEANRPTDIRLHANYPNPFNPTTTIEYELPEAGDVRLDIFSITGQHIRTMVNGREDAGMHRVMWDARDDSGNGVSAGVYFYRLQALGRSISRKMLLLDGGVQSGGMIHAEKRAAPADEPDLEYISYFITIQKEGYETYDAFFASPPSGSEAERTIEMPLIITDPPIADAGPDRVAYAGSYIELIGSGEARDGRLIRGYSWIPLPENPADVSIAFGDSLEHKIAAFTHAGDYYITMTIDTDGDLFSEPDTLKVTVLPRQESPVENPVVEIWLRYAMDRPVGAITLDDLAALESLSVYDALGRTESLEGLEYCVNLEELIISYNAWTQIFLRDISSIGELQNLTTLALPYTGIEDVSLIGDLTQLRSLNINNNAITDITPLRNLTQLNRLNINSNPITDISVISEFSQLEFLDISYTDINTATGLQPLSELYQLKELRAIRCGITDLTPLMNLDQLADISALSNEIEDIAPLLELPMLERVYISGNPLSTQSVDVYIPALKAKGVRVSYF